MRTTIIIVMAAILISGCSGGGNGHYIEESGTIETTDILISAKVNGTIDKIFKEEGTIISKGDTILIIDHDILDIQLRQAEAGLKAADAQLKLIKDGARKEDISQAEEAVKQAEANLKSAKSDYDRMENLYKSQAITKKQFEDVSTGVEIAESRYKAAKDNLEKIKNISRPEEITLAEANYSKQSAQVDQIKKQIDYSIVTSPSTGIVTETFVEEGENVNLQSSLVKISNLSEVKLVIYISETDLGKIELGQSVKVSNDTFPDKTYTGVISYISPEAEFTPKNIQTKDERTKLVFKVKVKIKNQQNEFKAGMPADAKIILEHDENKS